MKTKSIIFFFAGLLAIFSVKAQQVTIKADTVIALAGDSVSVPIRMYNLNNVGSITFHIQYSYGNLSWGRGTNWLPSFNNGFNLANAASGIIAVTALNFTGVTLASGKLLDLRFKYYGGSGNCNFQVTTCEITDVNGNLISPAPVYLNGPVIQQLTLHPLATPSTLCQGNASTLSVSPSGLFGSYTYQWASVPSGFTSTAASPSVSPAYTTRYYVTVSSGGHSDTASVLINVVNPGVPTTVPGMLPANGSINVNNPVTLSWAPATNATLYDLYLWKSTSTMPTNPTMTNFSQISIENYSLDQGATYYWKVVSKNTCYQATGPIYQFTMQADPELHVTQVTNSPAMAGQPIEISWTVKNDGFGPTMTPLWYDRVWLSPDLEVRVGEPEHLLLGTFPNISALAPGESYTQTQQLMVPNNLIGTYYIFVVTDGLDACLIQWPGTPPIPYNPPPYIFAYSHGGYMVNVVKEASDNGVFSDNFFYKEVTLAVPPLPDLKVTNIQKPATTFSGQSISVNWSVINQGQANTAVTQWSDKVYITQDTALNTATATLLGTFQHNSTLHVDSSYTRNATVTVPNYISGNYFIYVFTDALNQVFEHVYEANNITRSDTLKVFLTPPPDLFIDSTNVLIPATASNNEIIPVKYIVQNQGATITTAGMWYDRIFISQSPTWNPALATPLQNPAVHYGNLGPGAQYSVENNVSVPDGITGAWYIYIQTDINNNVFEYNENNNVSRSIDPINILNPDLVVSTITCPATESTDHPVDIYWYHKNQGTGKLLNSSFNDRIMISPNAIYDPVSIVAVDSVTSSQNIQPGDSVLMHKSCYLPNVNTGNYYVYVFTDSKNQVYENSNDNNNIGRSPGTILIMRPDLIVTLVALANGAQSGMPATITARIKNVGAGSVVNKTIIDKIDLSPTAIFNTGTATSIGTFSHLLNLNSGDSAEVQFSLTLPNGITGNFYLVYSTDFTNVVKEGSYENNNTKVSPGPFAITPGPWVDLTPLSINSPDSATAGYYMSFNYTIRNSGNKIATGLSWRDKIYRSLSAVWDSTNAVLMTTLVHTGTLGIDSSYTVNTNISLPNSLNAGSYYFYVFTDANNNVYEYTGEENNVSAPVSIYIKPYPIDIKVSSAILSIASINSGQSFSFYYSIANIGPVATIVPQWHDALYLSMDTLFDASSDILVGSWNQSGPLNPGITGSISKTINMLNGISGDFYLFVVTDKDNQNGDIHFSNNYKILKSPLNVPVHLHVDLTPAPNLMVQTLSTLPQVYSGQNFTIHYSIKNNGVGSASGSWVQKFYLSQDFVIGPGDVLLGTQTFTGTLNPDSTHVDSLTVSVVVPSSGNYVLILKTDADNVIYESNENDNLMTSFLIVSIPPPGDLFVSQVNAPPVATVGAPTLVNWHVKNLGTNTLTGNLKDAIYISKDTVLDASDKLWATYESIVTIPANGEVIRNLNTKMTGILPGNYYIFIKTDITNVFIETDETNNKSFAPSLINIDFANLPLNVTVPDILPNNQSLYYKVIIPDTLAGETYVLTMKGDSLNGINQIYAGFNKVPTMTNYDYLYKYPYKGNQELIVPTTQAGTYYFLVTGNTAAGIQQNITLLGKILHFQIVSLDRNYGGNSGSVTVNVNGSKFTPDMTLSLINGNFELQASNILFIDPSRVIATFGLVYHTHGCDTSNPVLAGIPIGFYNVVGKKPSGATTTLHNGFEVVPGVTSSFIYNVQFPASVRVNRFFAMSIQFVNTGNTDIKAPIRTLMSMYGPPIGLSIGDLIPPRPDLYMEFSEPGGPPHILRPGAVSEIKIYCHSSGRLVFRLLDN